MTDVLNTINEWIAADRPFLLIATGTVVAVCFVFFNVARVFLYIPQIATCWSDRQGCQAINLTTWCSWPLANASTGLYMWMFQSDLMGLLLNLGSASMCAATVAITVSKRRKYASAHPADATRFTSLT